MARYFSAFPWRVRPLWSGQTDHLQVLVPAALAEQVLPGRPLQISGQLRSYNNKSGQGSRLVITVLAQELFPGGPEPPKPHSPLRYALQAPHFAPHPPGAQYLRIRRWRWAGGMVGRTICR